MHIPWPCLFAVSLCLNIYLGLLFLGERSLQGASDVSVRHLLRLVSIPDGQGHSFSHELHTQTTEDIGYIGVPDLKTPDRLLSSSSSSGSSSGSGSASAAASSAASGSAGSSSAAGHHGPHQHDALLFLFNAIFIGTAMLHFASVYHGIQLTVVLFVLGVIVSLLLEGADLKAHIGVFGESYTMWMDIDPHLFLFALLPMLLAGDAMTIDTQVAKRVALQCLYLAGPGVMISSCLVATFLKFYFNWTFLLSMVTASILCATDPVAVVALLKELGASPMLTVQIQGESLLNDGTAIVLYTVCYDMLSGKDYDISDMAMFLVKTAMMAVAVGLFLGYLVFAWLRLAGNRFNHSSSVIQILLTLCAAYWSFCLAEGVLKMSGVLSTVGCSIVLAHHMWPHIVCRQTLEHFWHTLENLGNMIVFVLGGALTGSAMIQIEYMDYLNLLVIYLVLLAVRGGFIFASRPLLRVLSRDQLPVSVANAAVMTWGGLRGAVGLALAIQVRRGRAMSEDGVEQITEETANRVLFFVSGIGFLTTVVNATTCPTLVTWLGITALPEARHKLLQQFNRALVDRSITDNCPREVTFCLRELLHEVEAHIESQQVSRQEKRLTRSNGHNVRPSMMLQLTGTVADEYMPIQDIMDIYDGWRKTFLLFPEEDRVHLQNLPEEGRCLGEVDVFVDMLQKQEPSEDMCKAVNALMLSLVQNHYWKLIKDEELHPGSPETDVLFTSVRVSMSPPQADLLDIEFVLHQTGLGRLAEPPLLEDAEPSMSAPDIMGSPSYPAVYPSLPRSHSASVVGKKAKGRKHLTTRLSQIRVDEHIRHTALGLFVMSATFNITSAIAIVCNTFYVLIEEILRNEDNDNLFVWLVFEALFTLIFFVEFILKLAVFRCQYWREGWNVFDFMLVLLGLFGVTMSTMALVSSANSKAGNAAARSSSESRVIRVARVLRTMRFLRVFRILNAHISADKYVSDELAKQMHKMTCLGAFTKAHLVAQALLLKYLGSKATDDDENLAIARCVLQSQAAVYQSLVCTLTVQQSMDTDLLDELKYTRQRKQIVGNLEQFVENAQADGALTAREAEAILHPLHDNISQCLALLNSRREGHIQDADKALASSSAAAFKSLNHLHGEDDRPHQQPTHVKSISEALQQTTSERSTSASMYQQNVVGKGAEDSSSKPASQIQSESQLVTTGDSLNGQPESKKDVERASFRGNGVKVMNGRASNGQAQLLQDMKKVGGTENGVNLESAPKMIVEGYPPYGLSNGLYNQDNRDGNAEENAKPDLNGSEIISPERGLKKVRRVKKIKGSGTRDFGGTGGTLLSLVEPRESSSET